MQCADCTKEGTGLCDRVVDETMLRVYIAEDEPIVLLGFKKMVTASGHRVIGSAADGITAVKEILELRPDIILMDINLPKLDGLSVIETVHETFDVPAVVITGYRSPDVLERVSKAGVFGYLQKPVDEYEIKSVLQIAVDRHGELRKVEKERDTAIEKLDSRKYIEQAKGILMSCFGLSEPDAMKALQKKSKDSNRKLIEVANEIIRNSEMLK